MSRFTRLARRFVPSGWSLRLRLVGSVVVLMVAGLAVTGTLGVTLLRSYLIKQVDQQLATVSHQSRGVPGGSFPRGAPPSGAPSGAQSGTQSGQLPTPFVFTVVSGTGAVVTQVGGSSSNSASRPELSGITAAKVRGERERPFTVPALGGGSQFRVVAVPNSDGTSTIVALSLRSSNATVRRLELITVVAAAIVLTLLIALATVLVRIGLRPLRDVERTAERISDGDLS